MNGKKGMSTRTMVLSGILIATVILLQLLGASIKFGPFSISLVLIPIVIGAATCGVWVGGLLGLVFGIVVLATDAGAFLAVSVPGTVITVLLKGVLCGLASGLVYKWLAQFNKYIAVIGAALICPVVNTGVFLLGCLVFFMDTMRAWAEAAGLGGDVAGYMIFTLVGVNFLFEVGTNMILSPVIVRLLNIRNK
ncbi:MAG: ECF transporter S component [Clostridia bacterium]|nr:ECF transporter S component [Clostridia bacterium]